MTQKYNDPANGSQSSVGNQMNTFHYDKKALIEARKEQYFTQLADVTSMPKNFGKTIKKYHYIPMLDIQNINDQGIDAAGVTIANTEYYVSYPRDTFAIANASAAAAVTAINDNVGATLVATAGANDSAGTGFAEVTLVGPLVAKYLNSTKSAAVEALNLGVSVQQGSGNLYGSSKDVGLINGKIPALTEDGGFVNRVGFKRKEIEGSIEKMGIYSTYTQESLDFDSDAELEMHIRREMINGANEITEDILQIDLLHSAGVIRYTGTATEDSEIGTTAVTYGDLLRLSIDLDNNRTPKQTKVITGTRMVDTKTISGGRVMYIGSEMIPTLESMVDLHSERAFIPVQKYAAGGTVLNGEYGAVGPFRMVVVPEMMKWAGAGGDASGTTTHYETNNRYDVFPMLVVGDGSFSTIGFQTDGKTVKFKIKHSKPGSPESYANDPYGEKGFMSIKWYYGFLLQRPERIGLIKTSAKL
jgi:N4-gp56 family major capsid protein